MKEAQAQRLVTLYADMILRISYQYLKQTMDAEDICQTVFLKYLTAQPNFDTEEHEKAWIIRTTINACKDHLKSAFFRRTVSLEEAAPLTLPAVPENSLLPALNSLPEMYRICLYLYYYEDYTGKEIAAILGKSEAAVSQYLSRGRQKLRKVLSEERSNDL
jgi:RNA polymerase sigma-70 factor (ECF subfamily)